MRKFKNEQHISEAPQVFIPASCFGCYHPAIDSENSLQQCWSKLLGESLWVCVRMWSSCAHHMSGFEMEEGPHCTQHLLSIPWLLLTKPGFVKRCVEGSRLQLSSFCLNVSTKSNNYTWGFPALQLQIPWFL